MNESRWRWRKYDGWTAYAQSKLANVLHARQGAPRGVAVRSGLIRFEGKHRHVAEVLDGCHVRFALIGGCARNVYAPARATRDVDLSVALDLTQLAARVRDPAREGFDGSGPG